MEVFAQYVWRSRFALLVDGGHHCQGQPLHAALGNANANWPDASNKYGGIAVGNWLCGLPTTGAFSANGAINDTLLD